MKKNLFGSLLALMILVSARAGAGDLNEVTFFSKVQPYETVVDTTLVTQEGKRIAISKGTTLNVGGFAAGEAFIISRKDKPNGFVKRTDIAPLKK